MIEKDNYHYKGRHMESYNATWNFTWSTRDTGKSSWWLQNSYKRWRKEKATTIILRYKIVDITTTYLYDLQTVINQFLPDDKQVNFIFKKGNIKEGIVDVFLEDKGEKYFDYSIPLFRVIALSNDISRIKSMALKNCCQIQLDEAIINTRVGEKFINGLVIRFKEIYNTYLRCCHTGKKFKVYCWGNPFSHYHPLLVDWGVPAGKIKEGQFYYNKQTDVYVEAYKMKPELREAILKRNPLYKWDSSYTDYAFNGEAINDINFTIVEKQPQNYYLKYIFRITGVYLFVYRWNGRRQTEGFDTGKYWLAASETYKGSRGVFAVDLDNLISGTALITTDLKAIFWRLKNSLATRSISYESVEAGYLMEELYSLI